MSVSISDVAYTKMMLHAARYFYCGVDGLCIGSKKEEDLVEVTDVVPLFHNGTLAPMLEAAFTVSEKYAKGVEGKTIVGYYYANEHVSDESVPPQATSIGATIAEDACILQLANKRLEDPKDPAVLAYDPDGATKRKVLVAPRALNLFLKALDDDLPIVDFDLHLDDVSKDWRNAHVGAWLKRQ
ncbi:hypothetical protein CTAYLR_001034 [Chrysophaeum taylorii]|uniref:MPN domain-containing protein n=1 Tax=Chrysophaeum taylorii TaxID=2483200 RepID=A0AAD7UI39_9STRA|nr:hypothetical protein CTAYLR_001034 [Chrysophaeum taylorii]